MGSYQLLSPALCVNYYNMNASNHTIIPAGRNGSSNGVTPASTEDTAVSTTIRTDDSCRNSIFAIHFTTTTSTTTTHTRLCQLKQGFHCLRRYCCVHSNVCTHNFYNHNWGKCVSSKSSAVYSTHRLHITQYNNSAGYLWAFQHPTSYEIIPVCTFNLKTGVLFIIVRGIYIIMYYCCLKK